MDLLDLDQALALIIGSATSGGSTSLAVGSANLDHIKHFGYGSHWADSLDTSNDLVWLTLLDGAPLVAHARKLSGRQWPRLAGSDLTWPLLEAAAAAGLRVGFLGGRPEAHQKVQERLRRDLQGLELAGFWAPERAHLTDPNASLRLAAEVVEARADILFVCLGKPRQELWIEKYGRLTGAKVLLAFGAAVDFLAGTMRRAPEAVREAGMEWAWRLALEPRRLASRYLLDGPGAYLRLQHHSGPGPATATSTSKTGDGGIHSAGSVPHFPGSLPVSFSPVDHFTDVAVLIVAYNSRETLPRLLEGLLAETTDQSIKVIVADNSPTNTALDSPTPFVNVDVFQTGGNLGYAAGINLAMKRAGSAGAFLILNPDIRIGRGSIANLRKRMRLSSAGAVVPLLLEDDGTVYPSLRREPSLTRALGDAICGSRLSRRPACFSEMDFSYESYTKPHPVDWATGAALLVDPGVAAAVGDWDESYFLYSEETDFLRRVRSAGATVWFEPAASMYHTRGASGSSRSLDALMAANRVRYVRKFRPATYAALFHGAVILSALLRAPRQGGSGLLSTVSRETSWGELPHSNAVFDPSLMPEGSVIIPAHNEEAVLGRTLGKLAPYAAAGRIQVVVACNGCTDHTAEVARSFPGVRVVEISQASKAAALNEADRLVHSWPRIYLDADVELHPAALSTVLTVLNKGEVLAARPEFVYDWRQAHWLVQSYFRARYRMPSQRAHLWGAGVYGLNSQGHSRFDAFPKLTADDLYIDSLFESQEKVILHTTPAVVRTPREIKGLNAILRRTYLGNEEQQHAGGRSARLVELMRTVRGPASALDAAVYAVFAVWGRVTARNKVSMGWERDESSRRDRSS